MGRSRNAGDVAPSRRAPTQGGAQQRVSNRAYSIGLSPYRDSWVFFRAKTIGDAVTIISKIAANLAEIPILIVHYPFSPEHGLGAALIALLLCVESLDERRPIAKRLAASPVVLRWGAYYSVMFGLLILGQWQSKEFIYMQF